MSLARRIVLLVACVALVAARRLYRRENSQAAKSAVGRVVTPTGINLYGKDVEPPDHRLSLAIGCLAVAVGAAVIVTRPRRSTC